MSVGGGGRYDALGVRRQDDLPRCRDLVRHHPDARSADRTAACSTLDRSVPSAVLVALADEELARAVSDAIAQRPARSRHPDRGRADRGQKYGRQIRLRRAARHTVRLVPRVSTATPDQVKDIRSGDQVDADATTLGAARRRPASAQVTLANARSRHA